jgi:lipopolysaccharide/colanic/teichoic acid biosynthesis glycosyltransferase
MSRGVKRAIDVVGSAAGLLVCAPVLALVAGLIRLTMGSPVLFRQVRSGRHGRPFTLYKFRTMGETFDDLGAPLPDARRLTPLGRWLRSSSLDELPELVNVLLGEMSLVGPRPLLPQYLERYSAEQRRRHEATPGLTGWAQVHGRNGRAWPDKLALDVWYVDHWSLLLDVKILALTVWKVVTREGITQQGHATAEEFKG